jgi:hypothetical protein
MGQGRRRSPWWQTLALAAALEGLTLELVICHRESRTLLNPAVLPIEANFEPMGANFESSFAGFRSSDA